jgi:hypothetical protein
MASTQGGHLHSKTPTKTPATLSASHVELFPNLPVHFMNENSVTRIETYIREIRSDDPVKRSIAETELKKLDDINELIGKCLVDENDVLHEDGVPVRAIDILQNLSSPRSDHQKHPVQTQGVQKSSLETSDRKSVV